MRNELTIKGKWMCEPSDRRDFFRMVEAGLLDLGMCEVKGEYGLDDITEAVDAAAEKTFLSSIVVLKP